MFLVSYQPVGYVLFHEPFVCVFDAWHHEYFVVAVVKVVFLLSWVKGKGSSRTRCSFKLSV